MIREIINGLMRNNADTLDGKDSTEFLGKTEKAIVVSRVCRARPS